MEPSKSPSRGKEVPELLSEDRKKFLTNVVEKSQAGLRKIWSTGLLWHPPLDRLWKTLFLSEPSLRLYTKPLVSIRVAVKGVGGGEPEHSAFPIGPIAYIFY